MSPASRRHLGQAIARARDAAGLTQEALGSKDLTSLGQTVVSRIESGDRRVEALELLRIAQALGIEAEELLHDAQTLASEQELQAVSPQQAHASDWELLHLRLAQESADLEQAFDWLEEFLRNLEKLENLQPE